LITTEWQGIGQGLGISANGSFIMAEPRPTFKKRLVWKAKNLLKSAKGKILEIRCGESRSGSSRPFAAEWGFTSGGALIAWAPIPMALPFTEFFGARSILK